MKVIVFGATGMVGKYVVNQALFMGFEVKAFGRNVFTAGFNENEKLELVQGALFDEKEVLHAIQGCDAVISALGGSFDGTEKTRSLGMKNIVTQMQKAGVIRIVGIGGLGVLNAADDTLLMDGEDYLKEYLAVGAEHYKAYEYLKASSLDWTFVCPPNIIDEGPTGLYITKAEYPPEPNKFQIKAGDLSMFMLNILEKNEYVKQRVGISN